MGRGMRGGRKRKRIEKELKEKMATAVMRVRRGEWGKRLKI